jgi:membrane-associated protein
VIPALADLTAHAASVVAAVPALGPDWLDPQNLEQFGTAAFWIALAIIFAECGLLIGFFLPGDSLLFMVGLFIASGVIGINIGLACVLLSIAAVSGNLVGYWVGYRAGPPLFHREDSRIFKKDYVEKTHAFFEKYGARAIVLARFVPIVRTFITAMAGVGRMSFRTYTFYSTIGGILWATGVTLAGYYLGTIPFIKDNIEIMLIAIVGVSVIPIGIEWIRHRRELSALATEAASDEHEAA